MSIRNRRVGGGMWGKPDISLARSELGWEPKVQLDEGLKQTIEYFDRILLKHGKV